MSKMKDFLMVTETDSGDPFEGMSEEQEALAKFEEAIQRPDFSHVSYRRWCGVDLLYAYQRDSTSPSGVRLMTSCKDNAESQAILAKYSKRAQAGGQMGERRIGPAGFQVQSEVLAADHACP